MTQEEKEAAEKAAADKAKADKEAADKLAAETAKKEKDAADKAAKLSKKKSIEDLKSTDTVVVSFKNPVLVSEDGENTVEKSVIEQHVKYAFWLGLRKDKGGNVLHSTLRGAKLVGYVEDEEVIRFK